MKEVRILKRTFVALLVSVLAVHLRWSYTRYLDDLQILPPPNTPLTRYPIFGASKLAQVRMPPVTLSEEDLELWNKKGYAVVRGAVPHEVISELAAALREMYDTGKVERFSPQHQENFFMRIFGLRLQHGGAIADFMLHKDLPLGGLAAQLLRAKSVRVSNVGTNGVSTTAPGSKWHFDIKDYFYKDRVRKPMDSGLVRLWLPLWPDEILANSTGGSLVMLPLDEYEHYRDSFEDSQGSCFRVIHEEGGGTDSFDLTDHCRSWMQGRIRTPDVALGDVVFYSPKIWHMTQPIRQGNRVAITGQFYDPDALAPIVNEHHADHHPVDHDILGAGFNDCVDFSQRTRHWSNYWQSAHGPGLSESSSACFPQVYPSILKHEVQEIMLGRVKPGSLMWSFFLRDKAPMVPLAVFKLEEAWFSLAPESLHGPTKALVYTIAEWLGPIVQRAASLS